MGREKRKMFAFSVITTPLHPCFTEVGEALFNVFFLV